VLASKKSPKRFLLCIALGTHRLDVNKRVRDRFGDRLSFASVDEMRALNWDGSGSGDALRFPRGRPDLRRGLGVGSAVPNAQVVQGLKR